MILSNISPSRCCYSSSEWCYFQIIDDSSSSSYSSSLRHFCLLAWQRSNKTRGVTLSSAQIYLPYSNAFGTDTRCRAHSYKKNKRNLMRWVETHLCRLILIYQILSLLQEIGSFHCTCPNCNCVPMFYIFCIPLQYVKLLGKIPSIAIYIWFKYYCISDIH